MPSRPTISWSDLAGQSVGLWGLGVEGAANLRRLRSLGVIPLLVDDQPKVPEFDGFPVLATEDGGADALAGCDVVVKTPGISRYRSDVAALSAAGVAVVGGLGLWLAEADRSRVVCITGTKGKSTTAAIVGHLLTNLGHPCLVAGNIGRPPYDTPIGDHEFVAVETSSFQATDLGVSPPVVAVTSLHPDHLDWHGDVDTYYRDKLSACSQPGAALTVANGDSPELRARVSLLGPEVRWVGSEDSLGETWTDALGLPGAHNRRNALIARACLDALGVHTDNDALGFAASGFVPLNSRLRTVGVVGTVTFVDDSLSTNALSVVAALDAFASEPVAVVVGGQDRGIDYAEIGEHLARRATAALVVTLPDNGLRIGAAVRHAVEVIDCDDIGGAVTAAFAWAEPRSGTVLLSPGAPSFGQFANYAERSAAFVAAMHALREPTSLS
jgi:UDP-N-acetylmuramoyl-L-alanine---L-glutamate ligase